MSKGLLERILSYYDIEEIDGTDLVLIDKHKGERMVLCKFNYPIYLAFGNDISNTKEGIQDAIENGKVLETTEIDIYCAYYRWDVTQKHYELSGVDERTVEFFLYLKSRVGFIEREHAVDEKTITDPLWVLDGISGKTKDGRWCYQYTEQPSIEDLDDTRIYYKSRPNAEMIQTILQIEELENMFKYRKLTFICWECRRRVHWLDTSHSDLFAKAKGLKDEYCGC